ncbi:MAG TPA: methylmalonyl-CoA epimerase [Verrucomicrobiae bacterium]|nr:methylmalonyl-CoA epimerase [Verrucomicrobiae bacterium]
MDVHIYINNINNNFCMRVDHIAIAVNNAEKALENYKKLLNIDKIDIEEVPSEMVKVVMINLQDSRIELLEPMSDTSPISKFLKDRGEGIHHIAITADEIEDDVKRGQDNGVKFLGSLKSGSYGRKITFIHPKSMNGVLMELCQAPPTQ